MRIATAGKFLTASFCLAIVLSLPSKAASDAHYDIGGPCQSGFLSGPFTQIQQAEKSGSWDTLVELEKENVRAGCNIEYRWLELVNALLSAHRPSEAVLVLEEMDARGFEVNPASLSEEHSQIKQFMDTAEFKRSPIGAKVTHLRTISEERRAKYRKMLNTLPANQRPPENYVAKAVCPFECCRYGDWSVLADTNLFAAPTSQRIVGKAAKGTRVLALTGEVHLKPEPVVALFDVGIPKDPIAFVLDYGGEGYAHVYSQGKIVDIFVGTADYCFRLSESCWGETLVPSTARRPQVWWVKVKLANGQTGWTNKTDHFGNNDACG